MYQCTRGQAERTPIWLSPIWPMIEWGHVISRISMLIASLICAKQDKCFSRPQFWPDFSREQCSQT
jgi:hypothetical protein